MIFPMKTTIQVDVEVKKMLDELKIHERESYSSVIRRLIMSRIDDELLSRETLRRIEEALEDIKSGRLYTSEDVRRVIEGR